MFLFSLSGYVFLNLIFVGKANEPLYKTEEKLHQRLFEHGYNKDVRPALNQTDVINVNMKLHVQQIVDLNELTQTMTTNIWIDQTWYDAHLTWNPILFGNITKTGVPDDRIWIPDVALIENTDGNFTTQQAKVILHHDGRVDWNSPAIFTSICAIDAKFFPFDSQNCTMKFASWSYDASQVKIHATQDAINLHNFIHNGEWSLIGLQVINDNPSVVEESGKYWSNEVFSQSRITFCFIMQRLPLFYCSFLIAPCVGISFLTCLVFHLPSDSQQKIILSISVLLAHIFYQLVITEIMPATSIEIPLIAEYLLLNMIFITLSISLSTAVLNVHYRSFRTHRRLPLCFRSFILETAPRFLCMKASYQQMYIKNTTIRRRMKNACLKQNRNIKIGRHLLKDLKSFTKLPHDLQNEIEDGIESCFLISEKIKQKIQHDEVSEEWVFVANVLDRLFFIIFIAVSLIASSILIIPLWLNQNYISQRV